MVNFIYHLRVNLDFIEQARALSERARQIREADDRLRKQRNIFRNDPVNLETNSQQLDLLQKIHN